MIITLAFRNLVHDRVRLVVTLTGVVFAVVLITVQLGLFLGFTKSISDIIDHTDTDIWITPRGIPNYERVVPMTDYPIYRILGVPGVKSAERMVTQFVPWRKQSGGQQLTIVVGFDVDAGSLHLWNITSGSADALRMPDTVIIDSLYQDRLEIKGVGDVAEINGHRARVVGITNGIRSFTTSPFVFTSVKNSLNYTRFTEDQVTYLLVRTTSGIAPEVVKGRLTRQVPTVDVYTRQEFRDKTRMNWMFETGAGSALLGAALMALIVGIVIVAQTLYASTNDHLNEFATLRAMGAGTRVMYSIIVVQAVISGISGYVLGMGLSLLIARAAAFGVTAVLVTPELGVAMFIVTLSMCVIAAIASIRKVTKVEPAIVFRG